MWLIERLCVLRNKMSPSRRGVRLMECLRPLRVKTASSLQDVRSRGVIHRAVCPRTKKEAAKRFPVHKETLHHSQLRCARIACCDRAMRHAP